MIMNEVLPTSEIIQVFGIPKKMLGSDLKEPESVLSIARTCRQCYAEFLPIYYASNTFRFSEVEISKYYPSQFCTRSY